MKKWLVAVLLGLFAARREDVWTLRLAPGGGLAIRFVATP